MMEFVGISSTVSSRTFSPSVMLLFGLKRREEKHRVFAGFSFTPGPAVMPVENRLNIRQANPCPFKIFSPMQDHHEFFSKFFNSSSAFLTASAKSLRKTGFMRNA